MRSPPRRGTGGSKAGLIVEPALPGAAPKYAFEWPALLRAGRTPRLESKEDRPEFHARWQTQSRPLAKQENRVSVDLPHLPIADRASPATSHGLDPWQSEYTTTAWAGCGPNAIS